MHLQMSMNKPRALFVDDTPPLLSCFRLILKPLECMWELLYAASGEEALDIVCQAPVDVLICDLNMPTMTGNEVISMVQLKHPATVCYLMTGCAADDSLISGTRGLAGIFHKPCDMNQIRAALIQNANALRLLSVEEAA